MNLPGLAWAANVTGLGLHRGLGCQYDSSPNGDEVRQDAGCHVDLTTVKAHVWHTTLH